MIRRRLAEPETARDLLCLLAGAALLFLPQLGARDLWNPNEPLYGRAVVEMSRSGDWAVPTVNGQVFDEKPILYFWLALLASRALGAVDELSLRLPSAFAGLVGVAWVYLLVRAYSGRLRGVVAAFLFATTEIVFWSARAVQMDLLLAVCTLGAVLAATRVIDHGAPARRGFALAGLAAGLGVLAKGPLGLICPALALAAYAAMRAAPLRRGLGEAPGARAAPPVRSGLRSALCGAGSLLAVAAPWFAWLALRGEWGFLKEMLLRQNFVRFVDAWDHARPFWYYLLHLWIDMAPWALLLPFAVALPQRNAGERRLDRLAWGWLGSTVLFFSLSASKRSPYLLPAVPAMAILAAAPVERFILGTLDRGRQRWLRGLVGAAGAAMAAGGLILACRGVEEYPALVTPGRAVATLLVGAGLVVLAASTALGRRRPLAAPAAFAAAVVALYLLAANWVLPAVDAYKSARPFCEKLAALVPRETPLRSYRPWKWRASYAYYADRTIETIDSPGELERFWNDAGQVFLLVERDRLDEVRETLGDPRPRLAQPIGGNAVYLFTNR